MARSEIEKKSLEAHVELCAERYATLDSKLNSLGERIDTLEGHVVEIKNALGKSNVSQYKTLITIGTTVIGVLLTGVIGLLVQLVIK